MEAGNGMKKDETQVVQISADSKGFRLIFIPWCFRIMLISRSESPTMYCDYLTGEILHGRSVVRYLPHLAAHMKQYRHRWWEFKKKKQSKVESIERLNSVKDLRPIPEGFRHWFGFGVKDSI